MGELTYDMNTGNFSVSVELNDLSCNKSSIDTGDGEGIYVRYPEYVSADLKSALTTNLTGVNWPSQWSVSGPQTYWSQLVCNDNDNAPSEYTLKCDYTRKFDFTGEYYHLPTIFGTKEIKKVEINKRFYI